MLTNFNTVSIIKYFDSIEEINLIIQIPLENLNTSHYFFQISQIARSTEKIIKLVIHE